MSTDDLRVDRRKFLGGAAGVAGAAAFATWAPGALSWPGGPTAPIVGKANLAAQHFSVRDATARAGVRLADGSLNPNPAMGYLGGPNFPQDPTDLGPLVPLPGGYKEVFEFLGQCRLRRLRVLPADPERPEPRWRQPRHRRDPRLARRRRHQVRGHAPGRPRHVHPGRDPGHGHDQRDGPWRGSPTPQVLGHTWIGTAGDPSGSTNLDAWQIACANYSKMGELMLENYGIKVYLHPEQNNWNFITTVGTRPCPSPSPSNSTGSTSGSRTRTPGTCSSSRTSSTCTTPGRASRTRTARCGTRSTT